MKSDEEEDYVTVRIPRQLAHEIDEIIQSGTLGYKTRAEVVKEAIRQKIETLRFHTPTTSTPTTTQQKTNNDLLIQVKETFLAHTIINIAKGKTLPHHHLDPKKLEQNIRQYITKRSEEKGQKITKEQLDQLTEDLLKYHQEILEGLALITPK